MASDKNKSVYIFFTLMAVFCGVIWTVTNLGYDGEYQIAMSYRMLKGDRLFLEMWEPHQTSAFLPTALMWVYLKLFRTTTGIVLYLQACGILIRGGIAYLLYRTLRGDLGKSLAYGIGLFYFMVSPKDYSLPEFSNLQLWYSTLLFCCLLSYLKRQKPWLLVLGAFWLCLEVLSYPSCAIVLPGVILLLASYSAHKRRDILLFTGICTGLGLLFLCCFVFPLGTDTFLECISGMLALEPTHTVSGFSKILDYIKNLSQLFLILAAAGAAGFLLSLIPTRKSITPREVKPAYWLLCSAVILLAGFLLNILSAENRSAYGILLLAVAGAGFLNRNRIEGSRKRIYVCGNVIGGLGFLATLVLTDHPDITVSLPYGLLAAVTALIPLRGKNEGSISYAPVKKGFYCCFYCFMVLLAFRCVYIRIPLSGRGQICSVLSGLSVVRTGPAAGLISDEEGVCIQRDSYPEWKEWIPPGSQVWIVGGVVDTLGYLYEDVSIGGPSTMSTPSYGDAVLEYWEQNPDKYPDVVIAEGYLGELSYELSENRWLMSWLENDYRPEYVIEGTYWNYYFRSAENTESRIYWKQRQKEGCHMLFSELKCKDVINTKDCKKLGKVSDLEFDHCTGCIKKIIVPGSNKFLGFLNCEPDIVIPYKDICQIGPDIILVDIHC